MTYEQYKAEAEKNLAALKEKQVNVIKSGDIYYNYYNNQRYNYVWDPFDQKWLIYKDSDINNKPKNLFGKTMQRILMILAALKQGLSFTSNPDVYRDKDGNLYYYSEEEGVFVRK